MPRSAQPSQTRRWADLPTVADYLGVSTLTVRRRIADGTIPGHRLGSRTLRVDLNEVDAAMRPVPTGKIDEDD